VVSLSHASPGEDLSEQLRRLRADCARCAGLCCVALPFFATSGFPADKDAGTPCHHLDSAFRCRVHAELRQRGLTGCAVFDCFGAGQRITRDTFAGRTWCDDPDRAQDVFAAFNVARQLHEVLWYLVEALNLPAAAELHAELRRVCTRVDALVGDTPEALSATDVASVRQEVGDLLSRVSELVRDRHGRRCDHRGADLAGARLRGAPLRGATFRGAVLIAADLRDADLRTVDFLGADLRDADLRGADLSGALFLTQPQVNAARGDTATRLPAHLLRPAHWCGPGNTRHGSSGNNNQSAR
jgi:uncharacterized protein YjbI with pentapeptide repeats